MLGSGSGALHYPCPTLCVGTEPHATFQAQYSVQSHSIWPTELPTHPQKLAAGDCQLLSRHQFFRAVGIPLGQMIQLGPGSDLWARG